MNGMPKPNKENRSKKTVTNEELATRIDNLSGAVERLAGMAQRGNEDLSALARTTAHGFERTTAEFKTFQMRADRLDEDFRILRNTTDAGFQDIKHILKPLQKDSQSQGAELTEHDERLSRLEKRIDVRK